MATRKETLAEAQRLLSCSRCTAPRVAEAAAALEALGSTRKIAPVRVLIAHLAEVDDRDVAAAVLLLRELAPEPERLARRPRAPEVAHAVVVEHPALPERNPPLALLPAFSASAEAA